MSGFARLFSADSGAEPSDSAWLRLLSAAAGQNQQESQNGRWTEEPGLEKPSALSFNSQKVFWAMRNIPVSECPKHFLVTGTIGSGKTTSIRLFLQSIAPRFKKDFGAPEQLIIFDGKRDVMPMLDRLGLNEESENVYLLNPMDERSVRWSVGDAITTPALAEYLADLLIPEEPGNTAPFYPNTARQLVKHVIIGLQARLGKEWDLRDLICALDSEKTIRLVTASDGRSAQVAENIFNDKTHGPGVISGITSRLGKFEQVAALWHTSKKNKPFEISKFLEQPGVLVLGDHPIYRSSIAPMNGVILRSLMHHILEQADTDQPRHWFVLDEFRAMPKYDFLYDMFNLGRSKGVSLLLGIQSVEGIHGIHGADHGNEILGLCSYKSFHRAGGHVTAQWASNHFNQVRYQENSSSESWNTGSSGGQSSHGYTYGINTSTVDRLLFLPTVFLDIPFPGLGQAFSGVHDVPCCGRTILSTELSDEVFAWCEASNPKRSEVPGFVRRARKEDQKLTAWSEDEKKRFESPNQVASPTQPTTTTDDQPPIRSSRRVERPSDKGKRRPPKAPDKGDLLF